MKIDMLLPNEALDHQSDLALAESCGYDGAWVGETQHDGLVTLAAAVNHASRLDLGTNVAIAFARNPMTLAVAANDVQLLTRGRFRLGIGSQVEAHITRRYSMPWSRPAARMREFVQALRAIWGSWEGGEKLTFDGEFYRHTLMTPFFDPGPNPYGPPRVLLAAVGELMTEVAGEVADGLMLHPLASPLYVQSQMLPALERGRARGNAGEPFEISAMPFVAMASNPDVLARVVDGVRGRIAFYASTPAYRPILETHGWGDLQPELNALSRARRWDEQGRLISDDVLEAFAVVGAPSAVGAELASRYAGLCSRLTPYFVDQPSPPALTEMVASLRDGTAG